MVGFETRTGTGTGHVSMRGNVKVSMKTLDHLVELGKVASPDVLKIDVEGSEMLVLRGARNTIEDKKPIIILAVHSDDLEEQCRRFLEPLGYTFQNLEQKTGDKEFLLKPF